MNRSQRIRVLEKITPLLNERKDSIRRSLVLWEQKCGRHFPWRELRRNPYAILISELLLRRTTSKAAARVFSVVYSQFPTIELLLRADPRELESMVATIGLRKQRAAAFMSVTSKVREKFGGKLPSKFSDLVSIPYIGPYTAGAIMSFGQGRAAPVVDSNVERILGRIFADVLKRERPDGSLMIELAWRLIPRKNHRTFNYGLLDLGALVCRYDRPRCEECPLSESCDTGEDIMTKHSAPKKE